MQCTSDILDVALHKSTKFKCQGHHHLFDFSSSFINLFALQCISEILNVDLRTNQLCSNVKVIIMYFIFSVTRRSRSDVSHSLTYLLTESLSNRYH